MIHAHSSTASKTEYVKLAIRLGGDLIYREKVSQMLTQRADEIFERTDVARGWAKFLERAHRSAIGIYNKSKSANGNTKICSRMLSDGIKLFYDGDVMRAENLYRRLYVKFCLEILIHLIHNVQHN